MVACGKATGFGPFCRTLHRFSYGRVSVGGCKPRNPHLNPQQCVRTVLQEHQWSSPHASAASNSNQSKQLCSSWLHPSATSQQQAILLDSWQVFNSIPTSKWCLLFLGKLHMPGAAESSCHNSGGAVWQKCGVRAAPLSTSAGVRTSHCWADATSARPGGSQPGRVAVVALGVPSPDALPREGETILRGWSMV